MESPNDKNESRNSYKKFIRDLDDLIFQNTCANPKITFSSNHKFYKYRLSILISFIFLKNHLIKKTLKTLIPKNLFHIIKKFFKPLISFRNIALLEKTENQKEGKT